MTRPPDDEADTPTDPGRGSAPPLVLVRAPAPAPAPAAPHRARPLLVAAALVALGVLALLQTVARVPDDEMAPSLFRGDVVVILPLTPRPGDVVAIIDPLDPARWTLRRVETIGGTVRYDDVAFVVDDAAGPVLEMARDAEWHVLQEDDHLVRHHARTVRWSTDAVGVPDDAAFLSADDRDRALDSRWWGPVPLPYVQGVVVARLGPPTHPWRGWAQGRS